ncbi:MAG: helix-turn-helix transcriptional regulator [Rhodocyclaceae bacterium]
MESSALTSAAPPWQRCLPPPALTRFVDNFLCLHMPVGGALPRVLPGTGALCLFLYRAPLAVADVHQARQQDMTRSFVMVNRHQVLDFSTAGPTECVVISFRPGRLRYFVSASFGELQDQLTPAADLWGRQIESIAEQLALAPGFEARVELLSRFLLDRLHEEREARLDRLLDQLYLAPSTRIATLADEAGWSLRHFERLFNSTYGVSPKYFARVARLQQVARRLALEPNSNAGTAALDVGFFDQSHFIHELNKLARLSPTDLVRGMRERPHFYNPKAIQRYVALLKTLSD